MKTILTVCLMAFAFLTTSAQKTTGTSTEEYVRLSLAKGMVGFVNATRPIYTKGQDKQTFINKLTGTWKPTPEGTALLGKVYDLIIQGVSNETITNTYNGKEMAAALVVVKKQTDLNPKCDGSELFGGKTGVLDNVAAKALTTQPCKWYQFWCHVKEFFNWVIENWSTIQVIIATIIAL